MPDQYSDAEAAELYNVLNPWGPSDDFYLGLVRTADSVLDVGCGTGTVLHHARSTGHPGRLVGIDPDPAALAIARRRNDIEWWDGVASDLSVSAEFELAVMMSHAFQCLIGDDELHRSLVAIRRALRPGGSFAFETRNPAVRPWERWVAEDPFPVTDRAGRELLVSYEVKSIEDDVVTLAELTAAADGPLLRVDELPLRFIEPAELDQALIRAGFAIEARYGDWLQRPFEAESPEIISIVRT